MSFRRTLLGEAPLFPRSFKNLSTNILGTNLHGITLLSLLLTLCIGIEYFFNVNTAIVAFSLIVLLILMVYQQVQTYAFQGLHHQFCANSLMVLCDDQERLSLVGLPLKRHFPEIAAGQTLSAIIERYKANSFEEGATVVKLQDVGGNRWELYLQYGPTKKVVSCFFKFGQDHQSNKLPPKNLDIIENIDPFINRVPIAILLLDNERRICHANDFFYQNCVSRTVIKKNTNIFSLVGEDCIPPLKQVFEKWDNDGKANPLELHFKHDPEHMFMCIGSSLTADKQFYGLFLFDNSEQKSLHLQLMQSQKMQALGQLAGGIAHDFNNLLTAMIGFCDILLLRYSPGNQSFTDIMQIKQNANRAANLVRQLLAFSKQQTLQPQVLNPIEVISELTALLKRLVGIHISLDTYFERDIGYVRADKGQFEQVLINLVVNARDAMAGKGIITIRVKNRALTRATKAADDIAPVGNYVAIEVIDSGCGISKVQMNRIFDPFFSTKEMGQGTGLGLSTVYGIVQQTGGYIFVDSKVRKGTKFTVLFPVHIPEAQSTLTERKVLQPRDLTGTGRILLVEDEDAVRLFATRALKEKGYQVTAAANGDEALELLEQPRAEGNAPFDLIVTDVVMPGIDGPELARRVARIMPSIKVIFISGYMEDSFREKVGTNAAIHFLPKPFNLKDLALKVQEVLG